MISTNLIDEVKKIINDWHSEFPENFGDDEDILNLVKSFPLAEIVAIFSNKLSFSIKSQVLKELNEEMVEQFNKIKEYEKDLMLRQSTLLAQMGLLDARVSKITKKLKVNV